jgi:predicted TIM-barrel fold metal-dependent hydrolase
MILDGHIHIGQGAIKQESLLKNMRAAGIDGGAIFSLSPKSFSWLGKPRSTKERLDNLFEWVKGQNNLYPVFWIDPLENDASKQVSLADKKGVLGFKVICNRFFPGETRVLKVFSTIAKTGKPIFFHSGILWDGADSSRYNRPAEFEGLMEIPGLKFSLAHVSWPWCDENIAVYGKILHARTLRPRLSEMFVDLTPGTPPIYRQEVFSKLFTAGCNVENNVFFGTDCDTNNYNSDYARQWIKRDNKIYKKIRLNKEIIQKVYSKNLKRFLGI